MLFGRQGSSKTRSHLPPGFHFRFLSFVLFLLISLFVRASLAEKWPELTQGTYQVKEGSLLSQDWKIATVQFDFGEKELYFPVVIPCFTCYDKKEYEKADDGLACVCDYASKDKCGTVPKGCPKSLCDPKLVKERCEFKENPLLQDWTELKISQTKEDEDFVIKDLKLRPGEIRYFRFLNRNPCKGYKLKTSFHSGLMDYLVSPVVYQPTELNQQWSTASQTYPDNVQVDLCPEFEESTLGTYFVAVIGRTENTKFDLHLYTQQSTVDKPDADENLPCEDSPTHICIRPGIPSPLTQLVDDNRFVFFRFDMKVKPGECKSITVYAYAPMGDCGLGGDFVTTNPNYYFGPNPTFQSEYSGSDIHYIQKCFSEDEIGEDGVAHYYFGVYLWSIGRFVIRATENKKPAAMVPTSEISRYQYPYTTTRTILANCPGTTPQVNWMCFDWRNSCKQFWLPYPAEDPQPFWPTPNLWRSTNSPISAAMFSSLVDFDTPLDNQKPGTLNVVLLLRNTLFGKEVTYLTEENLANCTFQSQLFAYNKEGYALQGSASIKKKEVQCKDSGLKKIVEQGKQYSKQLQAAGDNFEKILQLSFQIDSLMFTSPWLSCSEYANTLLITEDEFSPILSTTCFETNTTSPEWINDPCCNSQILWKSCCVPRVQNETHAKIIGPDTQRIEEECSGSDCVTSYISDLATLRANSFQCATFDSDEYPALVANSFIFYTNCRKKYNIDAILLGQASCHSDADCTFGGLNNKCNFITSTCIGSRELEIATTKCIIEGLNLYTEFYFKDKLSLSGRKDDKVFLKQFLDYFSSRDCRNNYGHQTTLQESELLVVIDKKCSIPYDCPRVPCLDTTCSILPNPCLLVCQMSWTDLDTSKDSCKETEKCNWMGEKCGQFSDCEKRCEKPSKSFCAYCADDAHCIEFPILNDKDSCEGTEACLLPDGTMDLMSKEDCMKFHSCSQPCHDGLTCKSANKADNICVSDDTEDTCNGIWRDDISSCVQPLLGKSLCITAGYTFYSCSELSLDECSDCYEGKDCSVNQALLACKVFPEKECESKKECEQKGGTCSDSLYYNQYGKKEENYGTCIYPLSIPGHSGVLPSCRIGRVVPQGCLRSTVVDEATCKETPDAVWHVLAKNEDQCVEPHGCATFDQLEVLSNLNQEQCTACGKSRLPYYNWTPAKWSHAKPVVLQWQKREVVPLFQWAPTVDWELMQNVLVDSVRASVISDIRSQTICDFNVESIILDVVSCACNQEDGSSKCFDQPTLLETGSGRPCVGLGSTIQNSFASVIIDDNAVNHDRTNQRCTQVSLSSRSIFSLEQGEEAAFSPLTKVRNYDSFNVALNKDDAIVGRVMSDGILIKLDGELETMTVCLQLSDGSGEPSESFDQWDLGTLNGDNEFLTPMGLSPSYRNLNNSDAVQYCFEIEYPKREDTYFLIAREKNWEDKDGSLYGSESVAWWIFAAFYTCLAVLSLLTFVLHFFGYPLHFYFLGLFLFFTIMCIIRAVYFYLLGAEIFDDGSTLAVAYFLIELPTLLYFTAFSCLGAFWIFLLYAHFKSRVRRFILVGVVLFNTLLYILFVVLLILFQTLSDEKESTCSDRIPTQQDDTTQQIISIFYQSFMAGVSLLLASWVAISGARLLFGLKKRDFEKKIALVTAFCATGLLLHCAFILYMSIKYTYDFTIIVLMIVLSELVPIAVITLQFSFIRRTKQMPSYNKHTGFWRALFKFSSTTSAPTTFGSSTHKTGSTQTGHNKDTTSGTVNKDTTSGS